MTMLRPARSALSVSRLSDPHVDALQRLIDTDPLANALAGSRLLAARSLAPWRLGAQPLGVWDGEVLRAAVLNGGNLTPVGGDPEAWDALGTHLSGRRRECTAIVGPAAAVTSLWRRLEPAWGAAAREVRPHQPLLASAQAGALVGDSRLRRLRTADLERYLPASAAMFAEELGIAPGIARTANGYRRRAERLLAAGRVFGIVEDGAVVFKADIGALTGFTCQLQGVWVHPDRRGAGLGTAAMAAVLVHALALAPSVSLYVNDYNTVARRMYARLRMQQVGELATVLF